MGAHTLTSCTNVGAVNADYQDTTLNLDDLSADVLSYLEQKIDASAEPMASNAPTDTGGIAGRSSGMILSSTNAGTVGYEHLGYNVGGIVGEGTESSLTVSVRDLPGELRNTVESWQLTIPDDGQESHTVRYLPLEVGKKYKVYAKQDGSWKQLSTETIGSYLAFDLPGNTAELAVVPGSSVPAWVIVTAAAAVVLAGGTVLIRRRKKAPVKQAEE